MDLMKYKAALYAVGLAIVGILVLFSAEYLEKESPLKGVVSGIGSSLIVAGVVGILFELVFKKTFFEDITEKARLAAGLSQSGIHAIHASYRNVDWDRLLETVTPPVFHFAGSGPVLEEFRLDIQTAVAESRAAPT